MITLITGTPGQGKSAYVVWNEIRTALNAGRTVYYNGIPKLTLSGIHLTDDEVRGWCQLQPKINPADPDEHQELANLQEGALVVVDEAQRIFRAMGSGAPVPDYLAYLEYHRHHAIDFVLMTQHPKLVHVNARALVGRHIHLRNGVLGRVSHEFSEWCENPHTKSARATSLVRKYKLPKEAFSLYQSASAHTPVKKGVPFQFYILGFVFFLIPMLGYYVYNSLNKKISSPVFDKQPVINATSHTPSAAPVVIAPSLPAVPALEYHASNLVDWTNISGCISSKKQTACYDRNGVRVILPADTVRAALLHGWPSPVVVDSAPPPVVPVAPISSGDSEVPISSRSYEPVVIADRSSGA